jgi:Eukaryotic elongation factor 5A hypusine, DNA-binding OB fold
MSGWVLHCIVLHSACSLPANDAGCPPYQLSCDAKVSLMDADGNTKDDLKLPGGTDEAEKLAVTIQAEFDAGKELTVVVLKVFSMRLHVD